MEAAEPRRSYSFLGVLKYWGPLAVWFAALLIYSGNAGSAGQSGRLIRPVVLFFFPDASEAFLMFVNVAARKCVHVVTYGALALLAYRAVRSGREDRWVPLWAVRALAITVFYAVVDEVLQTFSGQRSGSIWDVLTDTCGGITALYALFRLRTRTGRAE